MHDPRRFNSTHKVIKELAIRIESPELVKSGDLNLDGFVREE